MMIRASALAEIPRRCASACKASRTSRGMFIERMIPVDSVEPFARLAPLGLVVLMVAVFGSAIILLPAQIDICDIVSISGCADPAGAGLYHAVRGAQSAHLATPDAG